MIQVLRPNVSLKLKKEKNISCLSAYLVYVALLALIVQTLVILVNSKLYGSSIIFGKLIIVSIDSVT